MKQDSRVLLVVIALATAGACQRATPPEATGVPRGDEAADTSGSRPTPLVVTYNRDIAPILYAQCATCHRPIDGGEARAAAAVSAAMGPLCVAGAPFPLLDYQTTRRYADRIAAATQSRAMPPWLPEPGHGEFANERRLTDAQIELIRRWVAQGAPEGDPADRPPAPTFASGGWQLGTPDLIVAVDKYTLEPGSRDVFRNFVVPVPRAPTRYVRGIEFRADNATVLHHASVAVDVARVSRQLDRADREPGFATMPEDDVQNVYGWSPGKVPTLDRADTAWALEEGSDLVVQLHMVATTTPEVVRPQIGLYFSAEPPTRVPVTIKLESKSIDIPAGAAAYTIEDSYVLPADVEAVSVYPHAHYLAKQMRGTATLPNGTTIPLIRIEQWDVRWQDQYRYRTPLVLPAGTTLSMQFTYDNSAGNRNNRNSPPQRVTWGPESTDEMGALWLEVVPRRAADARRLEQDYIRRAAATDIAAAESRVRANPRSAEARNLLALRYIRAGRAADALPHLQEALRLEADYAEALGNLGTVLQMQGRLPEGTTALGNAVRLSPNDDRLRFNYGNVLQAAGRTDEALREYQRAIRLNAENADAHFNMAMLLGPQNRIDEAIAHLRRVIEITPRNADAHRNLAVAFEIQGRRAEAIDALRTAVRLDPNSAAAQQQLNRLLAAPR